jgi:hypothetical protein
VRELARLRMLGIRRLELRMLLINCGSVAITSYVVSCFYHVIPENTVPPDSSN